MNFGVLIFVASTVAIALPALKLSIHLFPYRPLAAALSVVLFTRVFQTITVLVVGIFGIMSPISLLISSFIGGGLFLLLIQTIISREYPLSVSTLLQSNTKTNVPSLNTTGLLITTVTFILFLMLVSPIIIRMGLIYHSVHPLSWDVVSYHFPNVIDYLQTGSLWTTRGSFSVYPGGNELLYLWSFFSLKSDVFAGVNTALTTLGLFLVTLLITQRSISPWHPLIGVFSTTGLWIFLFSIPTFRLRFLEIGRNDLELGLLSLSILWSLQEYLVQETLPKRRIWMVISGAFLGMAIGIKPQAIYYIPAFLILPVLQWFPIFQNGRSPVSKLINIVLTIFTPSLLLGGFWYIRNLAQSGSITGGRVSAQEGLSFSIFLRAFTPDFYQVTSALLIILGLIAVHLYLFWVWFKQDNIFTPSAKLLIFYSTALLLAFFFTPFSSGYYAGGQWIDRIQLRYGVASLCLAGPTITLGLQDISRKFSLFKGTGQLGITTTAAKAALPIVVSLILATAAISTVQLVQYKPPSDLPGHNFILFTPPPDLEPSGIYEWVDNNITDQTIVSLGLRPYGLYGKELANTVFYNAANLSFQNTMAQVAEHQPQYLALSRDPFTGAVPHVVPELSSRPEFFPLVYSDPLAAVYEVTPSGLGFATTAQDSP